MNAWGRLKDPTLRRLYDNEMKVKLKVRTHTHANPTYTNIHIHTYIYTTDIVQIGSLELLTITIYMHTHIKVLLQRQKIEELLQRNKRKLDDPNEKKGAEEKKNDETVTENTACGSGQRVFYSVCTKETYIENSMC